MTFIRKFATPVTIFSSLVVFGTGLWMFFLAKSQLIENVHGKLGIVFFLAAVFHVLINKASFTRLLKTKQTYVFALLALGAGAVWALGTSEKGKKGIPPGMIFKKLEAASVEDLSKVFQVNGLAVSDAMKKDGIEVKSLSIRLSELAAENHKNPRDLLPYFMK